MPARRLAKALGLPDLLIKRDDLLGRALGGNKLRKLEYILPGVLSAGADALVTTGSFESNHVCLTAATARMLSLHPAVVLMGPASGRRDPTFNERILRRLDTEIRVVEYEEADAGSRAGLGERVSRAVAELTDDLRARGRKPFFIPGGGCCLEGTYAFVEAFDELHRQMARMGRSAYDIVLAVGTGSTFSGLWCGARRVGADVRVRGISIARGNPRCIDETIKAAERVCDHLGLIPPGREDLDITDEFVGAGYAKPTELSAKAVELALWCEGILLDHTYTGKALGGLLKMCQDQHAGNRPLVFWHTGGVPGAVDALTAT